MKRRTFAKRLILGSSALGFLPMVSWSMSATRRVFQKITIHPPKRQVRHGSFDLFDEAAPLLDRYGIRRLDRNVFHRNGFSPNEGDITSIHLEYGPVEHPMRFTILFDGDKMVGMDGQGNVQEADLNGSFVDDHFEFSILRGNTKINKGSLLCSMNGETRVSGEILADDLLFVVTENGWASSYDRTARVVQISPKS